MINIILFNNNDNLVILQLQNDSINLINDHLFIIIIFIIFCTCMLNYDDEGALLD